MTWFLIYMLVQNIVFKKNFWGINIDIVYQPYLSKGDLFIGKPFNIKEKFRLINDDIIFSEDFNSFLYKKNVLINKINLKNEPYYVECSIPLFGKQKLNLYAKN